MVVVTAACIERSSALNRIFSEMDSMSRIQAIQPFPQHNMRDIIVPGHVPVKRMASGPSSDLVRALPKRKRVMATSSPYVIASPGKVMVTPSQVKCVPADHSCNRKGLALAPLNAPRSSVPTNVCCTRDNMCCGTIASSVPVSTPPYGSSNFQFPAPDGAKPARRKTKLRKPRRKTTPYKAEVIENSQADGNYEAKRRESLRSQPNALVVYNSFLKQMEERQNSRKLVKKGQLNQSTGYSRGFTPNMTSTPQHKTPSVTSQTPRRAPVTSDYHSESPRSNEFNDSFDAFLKFIEEGALAMNEKGLLKQSPLFGNNSKHSDISTSVTKMESRSAATSSGIGSLSDNRSWSREQKELPKMFPIGAPLAASSPLSNPSSASSGQFDFSSGVWRPWC